MQTWMILDGIVVAIAVIFVIIGCVNGFIKTVVRLVGVIASALVAALGAHPLAQWLYETVFYTHVEQFVTEQVQNGAASAAQSLSEQIESVTASFPQGFQSLFEMLGLHAMIRDGAAQSAQALVPTVMEQLVTPLCMTVLGALVFLVIFVVLFILIHLLGIWMDKVFSSIPTTKKANRLLGGVLGFAESIPVVFALCFAVQLYMTLAGAHSVLSVEDIRQTYILEWLMQVNPIL